VVVVWSWGNDLSMTVLRNPWRLPIVSSVLRAPSEVFGSVGVGAFGLFPYVDLDFPLLVCIARPIIPMIFFSSSNVSHLISILLTRGWAQPKYRLSVT